MAVTMPGACPVCDGSAMTFARTFPRRIGGTVNVFYCMECESASSPFAPPNAPSDDVEWHKSVFKRNLDFADALLDAVAPRGPLLDVGCSIGSLLLAARNRGIPGVGYDLNPWSVAYGKEAFGLDLRNELWTPSKTEDVKFITCIMVLEHIHQPRGLLRDLIQTSLRHHAPLFLSVPFFERPQWKQLRTDNLAEPSHFFSQPHVHVTHFSRKGLERAARDFGANVVRPLTAGGWPGMLIS